jgi:hypothetical protein
MRPRFGSAEQRFEFHEGLRNLLRIGWNGPRLDGVLQAGDPRQINSTGYIPFSFDLGSIWVGVPTDQFARLPRLSLS